MNAHDLYHALEQSPIIAAIKSPEDLDQALKEEIEVIFVLHSDLIELNLLAEKIKNKGKIAFLHVDLVKGLSGDEEAIDFIKHSTVYDGIISTRTAIVRYAKRHQLLAIQRYFLLDSSALETIKNQIQHTEADLVEVLPNVAPKIIRNIQHLSKKPLIVGGLISDKEDIMGALGAGCMAISTTNSGAWSI